MSFTSSLLWWCSGLGVVSTLGCHIFSPRASSYVAAAWFFGGFLLTIPWLITGVVLVAAAIWMVCVHFFEQTKQSAQKLKEEFEALKKAA